MEESLEISHGRKFLIFTWIDVKFRFSLRWKLWYVCIWKLDSTWKKTLIFFVIKILVITWWKVFIFPRMKNLINTRIEVFFISTWMKVIILFLVKWKCVCHISKSSCPLVLENCILFQTIHEILIWTHRMNFTISLEVIISTYRRYSI